jgi:26S proteasome regulatory subunit N1
MGIIGAGTNNSRIAGLLRQLSSFYNKEPNHLFVVRLAQALLHMGKGLLTLNPLHSDRLLLNKVSLAAIMIIVHAATDIDHTLADKYHYLMYWLCSSIAPRMLTTVNEEGESIAVQVKVGQAVETVGQAGRPKTITGFQKHNTPVLLASTERAELATDEYKAAANVLEGVVILTKTEEKGKSE